ncbi:MAG: undecaprenyl-phosphate galactose phosphotransferase WbaP [Treponema sp.]|nr:undecaprenyl-phosphate galactose phosphotransferase WbaP [Treponema sp.]
MTVDEFLSCYKKNFKRTSSLISGITLMFFDAISIMICIGLAFFLVNAINPQFINFKSFVTYSVYLPLVLLVFYVASLYPGIMISPVEEIKKFTLCTFFSFFGIAVSIFLDNNAEKYAVALALIIAVPFSTFVLPITRQAIRNLFSRFHWWGLPAVIFCTDESGDEVINRMKKYPSLGYKPALIVNSSIAKPKLYLDLPCFPPSDELLEKIKRLKIKLAILCGYKAPTFDILHSFRYTINISKKQDAVISGTPHLKDIAGIIGLASTHYLTQKRSRITKRCLDLILIIASLPLTLPLCFVIAFLVKFSSPGPILFGHERVGKNGKKIKCWKFRSMYKDADKQLAELLSKNKKLKEEWEKDQKLVNDPRVTSIGKFLRKTSLDELPQLWNIFLGQMSFVGPRPITKDELKKYKDKANYVLTVTPGLSGMWQTSGRSNTGYEDRIALDLYYIHNWSIWLDIWIIIKTFYVVIQGKGAY